MDIFTVSFFGYRRILHPFAVESALEKIVYDLLREYEFVEFLLGRDGEFDLLAASVIRRCKERFGGENSAMILVLPYMTAEYRDNEQAFLSYYDEVQVCEASAGAHYRAAHGLRNRWMVDRSEMVIACVQRQSGGAYRAMRYAQETEKRIISVAEKECT